MWKIVCVLEEFQSDLKVCVFLCTYHAVMTTMFFKNITESKLGIQAQYANKLARYLTLLN